MQTHGDRNFRLPPDALFARLGDARWLVSTLTNVHVQRADTDEAVWSMRPALSFLSGSIENTLSIVERQPNSRIRLRIHTRGIGATAEVEIRLDLQPSAEATAVRWSMSIPQMTGLLKLAPKGLLQATAGKVVEEVWNQVETALVREAEPTAQ